MSTLLYSLLLISLIAPATSKAQVEFLPHTHLLSSSNCLGDS
ncbi:hypothetical protein HMPREF9966_0523 [Streptococcus anginosus SK52 = DSM 20563]|nr:hypothetical protein HMPREF9966_0523 [Streptococcus anginosus SK52 = DSM 20563]BBD42136.1 hypothetical protein SA27298_0663 [Streptococcus anginosus]